MTDEKDDAQKKCTFSFEVFGKVQRVSMRKFTKKTADALQITGWCENTEQGTVRGECFGAGDACLKMKAWLKTTGSPRSAIERAVFVDADGRNDIDPFEGRFIIRKVVFSNGTCWAVPGGKKPKRKKNTKKNKSRSMKK